MQKTQGKPHATTIPSHNTVHATALTLITPLSIMAAEAGLPRGPVRIGRPTQLAHAILHVRVEAPSGRRPSLRLASFLPGNQRAKRIGGTIERGASLLMKVGSV